VATVAVTVNCCPVLTASELEATLLIEVVALVTVTVVVAELDL
jgi:hypothetical protein